MSSDSPRTAAVYVGSSVTDAFYEAMRRWRSQRDDDPNYLDTHDLVEQVFASHGLRIEAEAASPAASGDALRDLLDGAPWRDENEGCSHHYANLTYPCSCTVPVEEVRAALAASPPLPERFDRSWWHYADDCPSPPLPEGLDAALLAGVMLERGLPMQHVHGVIDTYLARLRQPASREGYQAEDMGTSWSRAE